MSRATHWLEFGRVPTLIAPGTSTTIPVTQAAILLEAQEPSPMDEYLYAVNLRLVRPRNPSAPQSVLDARTPGELLPFFSPRSRNADRLLFAPRGHHREMANVKVYEGTPIPARFERHLRSRRPGSTASEQPVRAHDFEISVEPITRPLDPFFFKSSFRLRTDDDTTD